MNKLLYLLVLGVVIAIIVFFVLKKKSNDNEGDNDNKEPNDSEEKDISEIEKDETSPFYQFQKGKVYLGDENSIIDSLANIAPYNCKELCVVDSRCEGATYKVNGNESMCYLVKKGNYLRTSNGVGDYAFVK